MPKKSSKLPDFDPEDFQFGDHDNTSAGKKSNNTGSEGREHYGEFGASGRKLKKSQIPRDDDLGEGIYAGEKVSRVDLDSKFSEDNSGDDSEDDASVGSRSDISFEDRDALLEELKQLQVEEEQQLKVIASRNVDEVERGKHVKNQYMLWDRMLDVRIQMQPLLNAVNRLPSASEVLAFDGNNEIMKDRETAIDHLDNVIKGLLNVQEALIQHDRIQVNGKKRSSSGLDGDLWRKAARLEADLLPFCKEALDNWHQKVILASETSVKKQLRVINQGIWQQVESALRDKERLVARTQILRSGTRIACPEDDDFVDTEGNKNVFPDIFDDTDFYQQLLREWIESNPTRQAKMDLSGVALKGVMRGKAAAAGTKKVDTRASKGRKLRFDVQEKLVNYMVPSHVGPVPWADEKISELFASILAN